MFRARLFSAAFTAAVLCFLICILNLPCHGTELSRELEKYSEEVPEDVKELLPEGLFSSDPESAGKAAEDALSFKRMFSLLQDALTSGLPDAKQMLMQTLALTVGIALFRLLSDNLESSSLALGIGFCINSMMLLSTLNFQIAAANAVGSFLSRLCTLINSMIPMVGVLLATGGNVTAAVSETSSLGVFIIFCENFCSMTLFPVLSACSAFAAASAFSNRPGIDSIARGIKKTFTFLLGLMALILSAVMSGQTLLASKADSLGARTAKFAAGTFIPVVGGTVGEALRTVAAGMEYLRASVGIGAIAAVCVLLLPTLISLILGKLSLNICASCASFLGLSKESSILNDFSGFYGYLIAVCSICSILAVYALVLFVRISSAV